MEWTHTRCVICGAKIPYQSPTSSWQRDFFFYSDEAPVKCIQACPATATGDYTTKIPFPIDGPAGERLTGIQADRVLFGGADGSSNYKYVAIASLKVTTNFKPVPFMFQPSAMPQARYPVDSCNRQGSRKAEIAPGMTLTGIYFMHVGSQLMENSFCQPTGVFSVDDQDPRFGMFSIGPISQDLTASENGLHQSLEDE